MVLQETFVIEDCVKTLISETYYSSAQDLLSFTEITDYVVEVDFKSSSNYNQRFILSSPQIGIGFSYGNHALTAYISNPSERSYGNTVTAVANQYYHFKIEKHGDTAIVSYDGNILYEGSVGATSGTTRTVSIGNPATLKNLKIKAL